jgi:6-pyruvoyltetrahydropterin/6-carboxytetrahydropterin synthase
MKKLIPVYQLTKDIGPFECAHKLEGMPEGHQCGRLHGHSYRGSVTFVGTNLDTTGFLIDLTWLGFLKEKYDHRYLNEVMSSNPTVENFARAILHDLNELIFKAQLRDDVSVLHIQLSETDKVRVDLTLAEEEG